MNDSVPSPHAARDDTASPRRPAVSIIIPTYKTANYIEEALASVMAQTFQDFEIIVVNDGSPDTEELERALVPYRARLTYIVQHNQGVSAARNTGIAAACADLVALLDSDDAWEPHYLERQLEELHREDLAVVYANATTFGDPLRSGRLFMDLHPSHGPVTIESLVTQQCNVMVSVLARRDVLIAAGLFDESLRSSEDFDMWLRVVHGGWRIGYHRQPLIRYRQRSGSLSADGVSMCEHILRVFDKTTRELTLTERERSATASERARFAAVLRLHQGKRAFFAGDHERAAALLAEANDQLRRPKLSIAVMLMRFMPGLLLRAYDLRDRLVFGTSTR